MYEFDIEKPSTIDEAVAALASDEAQALGGGQTLIPTLKQRLAAPGVLVSLGGIDALKGIRPEGDTLVIGAGTCHADVAADGTIPALSALAAGIGDPAVRNRGTIGGSLANNDPSACYPAGVLGLGATVVTNQREIGAGDFFTGLFETALEDGEIITAVKLPRPEAAAYVKFEQPASRFALVGVFVSRTGTEVRVAVTGASEDGVFRWTEAEAALSANFAPDALDGMSPDGDMISDIHGSAEYRAHLVAVLTKRAVAAC
ncbi:xanthine dehydrogenase family protein subunit M [Aliiroseovarius sp.]|uniref:FAD binding domain-containing protein n=1 Tax=Aliiroseovarius sp. TaxID=1872442 RepID=UPI00262AC603|nr:xanthine dehydrogenase family protein subunit M [Aliiroseovarius sp.]